MTEPTQPSGGDVTSVRFYCTAGNGMEAFLVQELKRKVAAEDVRQIPGKVLFSSSVRMDNIKKLKCAERVFLLVRQDPPVTLPARISSAKAASILQSRLLGSTADWSSAVATWTRLQGELVRSGGQERMRTTEGKRKREEEGERVRGREEEKSGACDGQEGAQTTEGKRKWREEEEDDGQSRTPSSVSVPGGGRGLIIKDSVSSAEEPTGKAACCDGTDSLAMERLKNEKPSASPAPLSFRINCKCTGALSRCFNTQELSGMIGAGLSRGLGWKADLKTPELEVNVYLSDDHCVLGIPLTRIPLAKRSYIKTTGLRSTVAWAMGSLADIKAGSLVVDPMCGVGTILLEAAQEHKEAFFLGTDIDDGQLRRANENVAFADLRDRMELLKASSLGLPLSSGSVDAVVCDLPFGRKFGSKTDMATNLPLIITEMERVLCVGGVLVLLLSPQLSCQLKRLLQTHGGSGPSPTQETEPQTGLRDGPSSPLSSLKLQATHRVSLGVIDGLVHKYIKMKKT